ncbi:slipin family protein [Allorhodopirellula solitaria]|uniref:SPFH domain / Band 7 family protein n=1 Tax=Allorhodopirellula solitaria TaxID=2527987 RepID=A0A5C5WZW1_9BACT|nr:slipin family protein [Allorhodopirellula solitaria]TWT56454.1 SPFH domain / Band 7 family protein [Allorhodopirellula solitaria]
MFKKIHIRSYEVGLKFRDGEFVGLVAPGKHFMFTRFGKVRVDVASKRDPWIDSEQLDVIVKSGVLAGKAEVVDLKDDQRALVWIDGRFSRVLGPGLYAYWIGVRDVRVEVVTIEDARLQHKDLASIVRGSDAVRFLDVCKVQRDHVGVLFLDGRFADELAPGLYAFWKDAADARVVELDLRESQVDVSGQEIMTADKVTLRMNAIITYVVKDARRAISASTDVRQSLYRETQLALRGAIGARDLDAFLAGKDDLVEELEASIRDRASSLGLEVASVGIRDVILPGDMKDLMNKVTEAKKAAEANLISRREETAAMRSQANTAKLLADNPTLMRLRELEVLEKIALAGNMNIVLGEKGLADRVVNLL